MKNFKNCEPYTLRSDLHRLIFQHKFDEGVRRLQSEVRLQSLEAKLDEVTMHIATEEGATK